MKRFLLTLPTLVTLVFLQTSLFSQVVFHIETDTLSSPNPLNLGDSLFFKFTIFNQGTTNFNDSLYIVRRVNGFVDTIDVIQSVSLDTLPSDSENINTGELASAARYGGGINVVVIWPTGPSLISPTTTDSISDDVYIIGTSSLPEAYRNSIFQVYPNPSADRLRFLTDIPTSAIDLVQVMGINGQILKSYPQLPPIISLADLPKGTYLIQVQFKGGESRTLKVIRN